MARLGNRPQAEVLPPAERGPYRAAGGKRTMDVRSPNACQTMETKAPFDLTAAIQHWRENLAQSPAFRAENLAELESHLRDSITRLQTTGLSVDEAFVIAEM